MRKRILLSMLAMILAFTQVWAAPVDSIRIDQRTTGLPNHLNSVELADGDVLLNGLTPSGKGVDVRANDPNGGTSGSYTWDNLPSVMTFSKPVDGSDSKTITTIWKVSGFGQTAYDAQIYDDTDAMFSVSERRVNVSDDKMTVYFTVTYKPTAAGVHKARLCVTKIGGALPFYSKSVELIGTAVNRRITPNVTELNFGNVAKGKSSSLSFTVNGTNLTDRMHISSNNSYFTVSPTSLPAGGGTVTVTFKPTATGYSSGTVTISGGGAVSKTVSVKGTGVIPAITASPSSLALGTVVKGKTALKSFSVTGTNLTGSLTVTSSDPNFTVSPSTITASEAAAGKSVFVTYKPTATGSHSGTITISGGGATKKTVSVSGTCVVPEITTSVTSLAFGTVAKNSVNTKEFTVNGTNLTGNLTVSASGSYFTVSPTTITAAQAKAGATVTVTYKPTAAGSHSGTITIKGGDATSKTVSVSGKCAEITPSVTSLSCGTTAINKAVTKTLTVTGVNLTGSLTLSTNSSYFTVSPTTITASEAAAGKTVTITYKPTSAGTHSATLTIKGGSAATQTVSLSGKCAEITVNPTSLAFGNVVKGNTSKKTFTVKGTNLTGSLTVSSSNSTIFSVSPTTITASEAAAGKTVTVTYKPTAVGSHSATITVKGGSATSKTVSVSGTCVVPEITVSASSLTFASYNDSRTLTVKGTNLTGSLTLTTSGYFSVSPTTITVAEAKAGKTVVVQCTAGKNAQRATGVLTISGGGASAKKVTLTFDATSPVPYAPVVLPDEEESGDERNGGELQITQEVFGNSIADVNELVMDVKIYAEGGDIVIETPVEQSAIISDIAGRARRVNLEAGRNVIPGNGSGIHIVRVGEKTAKLMLR